MCTCEFGLTCCPCSQHICAIVRLSGLSFVSEQDERCCQISWEYNGSLCREVCYGPAPSHSLYQTIHLHWLTDRYATSIFKWVGIWALVMSYLLVRISRRLYFQAWRLLQDALLSIKSWTIFCSRIPPHAQTEPCYRGLLIFPHFLRQFRI